MARLPVQAAAGAVRRLFHSSSNSEAVKRITTQSDSSPSFISCVLWPLASPVLGYAAVSWAGASGHGYHRRGGGSSSSTEEEHVSEASSEASTSSSSASDMAGQSSSTRHAGSSSRRRRGAPAEVVTQQLRDLQQALDQDSQPDAVRDMQEAQQLPEHMARIAMRDPLGVLISSLGVPLGISLKVNRSEATRQHTEDSRRHWNDFDLQSSMAAAAEAEAEEDAADQEGSQGTWASEDAGDASMSVPDTDMQRLRQELHITARRMARKLKQQASSAAEAAQQPAAAAAAAAAASVGVQQQLESIRSMIRANADRWGTTKQSPAEIAQQIADSNRAAGSGGGGSGGGGDGDGDGGEDGSGDADEPLSLSPGEERYADASAVGAELKEMDEIFEVLAKVPWLDDEDVDERELRGLAAVGLLGTLEEVGWTIRDKLLALWDGERDEGVLTAGLGPREAAAMGSILYHTQQLEQQFGKPPPQSVEAALAAANLGSGEGGAADGQGQQ